MTLCILAVTGLACLYGLISGGRPRTPLFYKIVVYAFGSYFLGSAYSILFTVLVPNAAGFHAGYMGYVGTFFFLFSSYFGALDRLADGREAAYRIYRIVALVPPVVILVCGQSFWNRILLIPVAGTAYFACKHLILPDVEMGIIRVMRFYNGCILLFCLIQPFTSELAVDAYAKSFANQILAVLNLVLVALALPTARRGVQKWFI